MTQPTSNHDEFSWASPNLRQQILSDPVGVLKDRGIGVPAEIPLPILHDFVRIASLLWVDGKVVPLEQFYIDPADEGLLFGRGVWESTRTVDGVPWLWPMHLDRLRGTAEILAISVEPERLPNSQQVTEFVRSLTSTQDVILRLNVTAGRPGHAGIVWLSAALQPYPVASMRLKTCLSPVLKGHPYQTLKTFQYATRLRIGQQAMLAGFDTALLLDSENHLLESSHANIFVRLPDGWATPIADGGFLPGIVRQCLVDRSPLPIRQQTIPKSLLSQAREVFVTNSNVGIIPVTQIDDQLFPIGEETRQLIRWLEPPTPPGVQYRFVQRPAPPR